MLRIWKMIDTLDPLRVLKWVKKIELKCNSFLRLNGWETKQSGLGGNETGIKRLKRWLIMDFHLHCFFWSPQPHARGSEVIFIVPTNSKPSWWNRSVSVTYVAFFQYPAIKETPSLGLSAFVMYESRRKPLRVKEWETDMRWIGEIWKGTDYHV